MNYDEQRVFSPKVTYLEQGTESLAYGVDYVYKADHDSDTMEGYIASCSFYNHLMHVWKFGYSSFHLCFNTFSWFIFVHCQHQRIVVL